MEAKKKFTTALPASCIVKLEEMRLKEGLASKSDMLIILINERHRKQGDLVNESNEKNNTSGSSK